MAKVGLLMNHHPGAKITQDPFSVPPIQFSWHPPERRAPEVYTCAVQHRPSLPRDSEAFEVWLVQIEVCCKCEIDRLWRLVQAKEIISLVILYWLCVEVKFREEYGCTPNPDRKELRSFFCICLHLNTHFQRAGRNEKSIPKIMQHSA